ncbi:Putative F-box protein At3g25750 [Linum grandiflorum]
MTICDTFPAAGLSSWADLPEELLLAISDRFDFTIDVLRFRSVCTPWRSSLASPYSEHHQQQTPPPVSVRLPFSANAIDGVLAPFAVYRMQFQPPIDGGGGWLVKIQKSERGKLELVNPITNLKLRYSTLQLSSLDFNLGDQSWTLLDDTNSDYDDLIHYRDRFYVVDRSGSISWMDSSSLKIVRSEIPPPVVEGGQQKNLVESEGDLYMVDRYLDGPRRNWRDVEDAIGRYPEQVRYLVGNRRRRIWNPSAVDFKVYRLDEEMGKWVDVESLDGRVFVITNEFSFSFSFSFSKKCSGGGNCIYYSDDDDHVARAMMRPESVRVFRFKDRSINQLSGILPPAAAELDFFGSPPALCLLP